MNLDRTLEIYEVIKNRLPSTYPKPKIAFFEDEECMLSCNSLKRKKNETVFAVVNPKTFTMCFPLNTTSMSDEFNKTISLPDISEEELAFLILHEIAHLYAGERYGYDSKFYNDEKYCDSFAARWVKTLKKENILM